LKTGTGTQGAGVSTLKHGDVPNESGRGGQTAEGPTFARIPIGFFLQFRAIIRFFHYFIIFTEW
jgi:hypothetical protein